MTNIRCPFGRRVLWGLLPALTVLLSAGSSFAQKGADGKLTFEVYKDKGGEYRWRLKSGNEKILAVPEDAYKNHSDVKSAIESIRTNVAKMKVEYYEDKGNNHRWRLKAANGRVMARSSEGYTTKEGAEKAVAAVKAGIKTAAVVDRK